jgi:hypothetical protein
VAWKSFASWSLWQIALVAAAWVTSVIAYVAVRTTLAAPRSTQSTDTYFIVVHVHHPVAVFIAPPLSLLARISHEGIEKRPPRVV